MAGTNELKLTENEDSFQWDEQSQLYYHASSGFYHEPNAGWYYSTKDGLYYKFENGNYELWETDQADESNFNQEDIVTVNDDSVCDESYKNASCDKDINDANFEVSEFEVTPNKQIGDTECLTSDLPENLPPPSEWLEDTLIELYLSGYPKETTNHTTVTTTLDDNTNINIPTDDNDNADELEEGEWVPDETRDVCGVASDEDEEEMWHAQYGQTVNLYKERVPDYAVVDLWDWSMVKEKRQKNKKHRIRRLIGRLVKRSTKLHPSMPSSGRVLKTAPISHVHLDLVRVKSGRVYKLRSPKVTYLASLSSYDSSNPTKDWGFPELSMEKEIEIRVVPSQHVEKVGSEMEISSTEKQTGHTYRDRAAERRMLHGGFGVGPGQKKSMDDIDSDPESSSRVSVTQQEATEEALKMSFGVGSYARRMLENMGWKEGESLGRSMKGLTEPLEAVGNKGSSGLGWNHNTNRFMKLLPK